MRRFLCAMAFGLATCFVVSADGGAASSTLSDFEQALVTAQAQVPGGQLLRGRVEGLKTGGSVFGFYFWKNNRIVEIEINQTAAASEVTKVKDEQKAEDVKDINPDVAALVGKSLKSKIPEGRLLEIAADNLKGTRLSEVKYEKDGDKLILVIGDVRIDAASGQVLPK